MNTSTILACAIVIVTTLALLAYILISQLQNPLGSNVSKGIIGSGSLSSNNVNTALTKSPAIFITGPSNSGKTALFTVLTTGKLRNTVISQTANVKSNFHGTNVALVDFPGHIKLRYKLFDELVRRQHANGKNVGKLRGVVFMVDATTNPKRLTETAEFLLEVLKYTELSFEPVDVLIACNKSESFVARPALKIKDIVEKEIGECIKRSKGSLGEVNGVRDRDRDDGATVIAGGGGGSGSTAPTTDTAGFIEAVIGGESFSFDMLEGTVEVADGSVVKRKLGKWEEWIDGRVE